MELNHIANMDCLEYLRTLPDNCVDLVVTDPPYNVSQKKDMVTKLVNIKKNFGDWDFGFDPVPVLAELKRVLKPHGQIYIFCGTKQVGQYMAILEEKWFFRNLLVWSKTNPPPRLSKSNYVFANEYIMYAINEKVKPLEAMFNYQGHKEMFNLFLTGSLQGKERLRDDKGQAIHPTQKPLSILKHLIEVSSKPGDVVLDPFMGVGSTAVAAKELGRRFLGAEINSQYVGVAQMRLV